MHNTETTVKVRKNTGFAMISNAVMRDTTLSQTGKMMYAIIAGFSENWEPSVENIAKWYCKECRETVTKGLNELVEHGYAVKHEQENHGGYSSTWYEIIINPDGSEKYPEELSDAPDAKPAKAKKKEEVKHRYGEYENVLLTDTELEKLKTEFPEAWERWIEKLSFYMRSTGKKYKDHLATIRNWARRDEKQKTSKAQAQAEGIARFLAL